MTPITPLSSPTRIVIVDDHPVVRDGIASLLSCQSDLAVCGMAGNAHEAMEVITTQKPDMAIIDLSLNGISGLDLIHNLRERNQKLAILVLSMHDEALYAERALRAGANGYIMKQAATDTLLQAVYQVLSGNVYLSEKVMGQMVGKLVGKPATSRQPSSISPLDRLTDRELEVLELIGQCVGTSDIAQKLAISVKTVETYRAHIKDKLCLQNAAELLRYAIQWWEDSGKTTGHDQ